MNNRLLMIITLISISSGITHDLCARNKAKKCVRYVQAGAQPGGTGQKNCPYNSLEAAQEDTNWDTLIVLPSYEILDGSIVLRNGTTLKGTKDPTCDHYDAKQSVITNSDATRNGGNAVVVQDSATVKDLVFKNTYASAIVYNGAQDVTIKRIVITGHNTGEVTYSLSSIREDVEIGGIFGETDRSGTTTIEKVLIQDNTTGTPIQEYARAGAQREVSICRCEMTGIHSSSQHTISEIGAVTLRPSDTGTICRATIDSCYIHDFLPNANQFTNNLYLWFQDSFDAQLDVTVCSCAFSNPGLQSATPIYNIATIIGATSTAEFLRHTIAINDCHFFVPENSTGQVVMGILKEVIKGTVEASACNNRFTRIVYPIFSTSADYLKEEIVCNEAQGAKEAIGAFYTAVSTNQGHLSSTARNNTAQSYIAISAHQFVSAELELLVEHNCFLAIDKPKTYALFGSGDVTATIDAGGGSLGSHGSNNFVGFATDIYAANFAISAQHNWWGPGTVCTTNNDCTPTQECRDGSCVGPDTVILIGSGSADVSEPLSQPAQCCGCSWEQLLEMRSVSTNGKTEVAQKEESLWNSLVTKLYSLIGS